MPIFERGYRPYDGPVRPAAVRWWPITRTGVRLAFGSKILRRMIYLSWAPGLYYGLVFYLFAQALSAPPDSWWRQPAEAVTFQFFKFKETVKKKYEIEKRIRPGLMKLEGDLMELAPAFWTTSFFYFFVISQSFVAMIIVAIVGPPLISQDLRNRSYLIYFAKPIMRGEYILGKTMVVITYLLVVTLVPGVVIFLLSIAFSPSLDILVYTAPVLPRIFLASIIICVPVSLIVLYLSSLTHYTRYSIFGWIAICLTGEIAFHFADGFGSHPGGGAHFLLSIRQTLLTACEGVFDVAGQIEAVGDKVRFVPRNMLAGLMVDSVSVGELAAPFTPRFSPRTAYVFLSVISGLCLIGIYRRISAPMKI